MVSPPYIKWWSMSWNLNLFTYPKFTIQCGQCKYTFSLRIPMIDNPVVECPHCKTLNQLPMVIRND